MTRSCQIMMGTVGPRLGEDRRIELSKLHERALEEYANLLESFFIYRIAIVVLEKAKSRRNVARRLLFAFGVVFVEPELDVSIIVALLRGVLNRRIKRHWKSGP